MPTRWPRPNIMTTRAHVTSFSRVSHVESLGPRAYPYTCTGRDFTPEFFDPNNSPQSDLAHTTSIRAPVAFDFDFVIICRWHWENRTYPWVQQISIPQRGEPSRTCSSDMEFYRLIKAWVRKPLGAKLQLVKNEAKSCRRTRGSGSDSQCLAWMTNR